MAIFEPEIGYKIIVFQLTVQTFRITIIYPSQILRMTLKRLQKHSLVLRMFEEPLKEQLLLICELNNLFYHCTPPFF